MDRYTIIIAVISLFAFVQRLLREDVQWFPTLASPYRGLVLAAIQMVVAPALDALLNQANVVSALVTGLIAVVPTILNLVGSLTANKQAKLAAAKVSLTFGGLLLLLSVFAGCNAVCPIIKAADDVCPFVVVELANGQKEEVSCNRVRAMAAEQHAARLRGVDGGAK